MENPQASERVFSTGEVANRLGVSTNMARRYGLAWERLTGEPLPQQPGRGRMYPQDTVDALEAARAWLIKHPVESVETALKTVLNLEGDAPAEEAKNVPGLLSKDDISEAVREAVRVGITEALQPLMAQLEAVRAENASLRVKIEALPAPSEGSVDKQKVTELEKRNQALRTALEAKEREEQERQRPWWRLWQRKKPTLGEGRLRGEEIR